VTRSADDGATWVAPVEITGALRAFPFPWTRLGIGTVNGISNTERPPGDARYG